MLGSPEALFEVASVGPASLHSPSATKPHLYHDDFGLILRRLA